jgi:uncharacterized protein
VTVAVDPADAPEARRPPGYDRDLDGDPWWEALATHRVVVQACPACARHRLPRMPSCPWCGTAGGDDVEVEGTGVVYSFVRAHRALTPAMADAVPYALAAIDLDGGGRVFARVEPPEAAAIGLRVRPSFVDHVGWTELRMAPADVADVVELDAAEADAGGAELDPRPDDDDPEVAA